MNFPRSLVSNRETQFFDIPHEVFAQKIVDDNLGRKDTGSLRLTCKNLYFDKHLLKAQTNHIETLVRESKVFRLPGPAELSADFVLRGYEHCESRWDSLSECTQTAISSVPLFFFTVSTFFCILSIFPQVGVASILRKEDLAITLPLFIISLFVFTETATAKPIRKILEWVANRDEWKTTPINDATPLIRQMNRPALTAGPTREEIREYLLTDDAPSETRITFPELLPSSETIG